MKQAGTHEGCIEQIQRLFSERLYKDEVPTDEQGRIRIDDLELADDTQAKVEELWAKVSTDTLGELGDLQGYNTEFFKLFGFKVEGIDYEQESDEMTMIAGLQ